MPHSAHSDMNFWLLTNIGGFRSDYPVSDITDIITIFGSHFREKNWKWKWHTFFRPFSSLLANTFHSLSRWACLFMGFTLSTWLSYIQLENVKDFLSSRQTKNSRLHRCVTRSRYGLFLPMQCDVQTKKITNWLQDKANEACFYLWSLIRWTSDVYGGWVTCLVNGMFFQFEPSQKEARSESWSAPRLDPTTNISKHRGLQGATMTTDSMRSFNLFLYYEWAICLLYLKEHKQFQTNDLYGSQRFTVQNLGFLAILVISPEDMYNNWCNDPQNFVRMSEKITGGAEPLPLDPTVNLWSVYPMKEWRFFPSHIEELALLLEYKPWSTVASISRL